MLGTSCATLSPEAKTALRQPGSLSMLRAPPPMREERRAVQDEASVALVGGALALGLVAALATGGLGLLRLGPLGGPPSRQVQLNAGTVDGVSPSDILSLAVQERLAAQGYATPDFVPGVSVRFDYRANELPAGIPAPTEYVLKAQVDRVQFDGQGVPTRLVGSLTLFEARRAVLHAACSQAVDAGLARQDAWLRLLRGCATMLVEPFEAR